MFACFLVDTVAEWTEHLQRLLHTADRLLEAAGAERQVQ